MPPRASSASTAVVVADEVAPAQEGAASWSAPAERVDSELLANTKLVVAVRGPAKTGKTRFLTGAAALRERGYGRLLVLDLEGKCRLVPGNQRLVMADQWGIRRYDPTPRGSFDVFDIAAIKHLDLLVDQAIGAWGRERGVGLIGLDSFALLFGPIYGNMVQAVRRENRSDRLTKLTAEQLQIVQVEIADYLRRLCREAPGPVIITDQLAAKGKEREEAAENEITRLTPPTAGALEYYADVVFEAALVYDAEVERTRQILRVVNSNTEAFEMNDEVTNPTMAGILTRFRAYQEQHGLLTRVALDTSMPVEGVDELAEFMPTAELLSALLVEAEASGVRRSRLETTAQVRHDRSLSQCTTEQLIDVRDRMREGLARERARQLVGDPSIVSAA